MRDALITLAAAAIFVGLVAVAVAVAAYTTRTTRPADTGGDSPLEDLLRPFLQPGRGRRHRPRHAAAVGHLSTVQVSVNAWRERRAAPQEVPAWAREVPAWATS